MRTDSRLSGALLCGLSVALCACARGPSAEAAWTAETLPSQVHISASVPHTEKLNDAVYNGRWEFVSHREDGRYEGLSVRSFHAGDSITVIFVGNRMRIFGVTGKNGGDAFVLMAGNSQKNVSFTSARKKTHQLVYDSGILADRVHSASVVVVNSLKRRGYVNVDEIEIDR